MHRIISGDVLRFAAHYRGPKFHAVLCDPPYEIGFMGKSWDSRGVSFRVEAGLPPTIPRANHHPTVKPIALTEYLARLILPAAVVGDRRILVPFAGSGSECIGALLAGWETIIGVEREDEYVRIARARLEYHGTKRD